MRESNHKCAAQDCETRIKSSRLMCRDHWYKVKPEVRAEIWTEWKDHGMTDRYAELVKKARVQVGISV